MFNLPKKQSTNKTHQVWLKKQGFLDHRITQTDIHTYIQTDEKDRDGGPLWLSSTSNSSRTKNSGLGLEKVSINQSINQWRIF